MDSERQETNVAIDLSYGTDRPRLALSRRPNLTHTTRILWRHRIAVIGSLILSAAILIAIFGPLLLQVDPIKIDLAGRLRPPFWVESGTREHLLGTDHLGRDVLSRTIFGARISLLVGFVATAVATTAGVILGLASGFFGGLIDDLIMRVVDIQQSFPFIALAIAVVAALGPGLTNTIVVLGIGGWVLFARVVRGEVLSIREKDYVEAARAVGVGNLRIMFRHILPNIASPVIVIISFCFALMIVTEASLSFIGLGVQPPESTWGLMLSEAQNYMQVAWWLPTFPGLAIIITVLSANLLGDWLRDVLDPRLRNL